MIFYSRTVSYSLLLLRDRTPDESYISSSRLFSPPLIHVQSPPAEFLHRLPRLSLRQTRRAYRGDARVDVGALVPAHAVGLLALATGNGAFVGAGCEAWA